MTRTTSDIEEIRVLLLTRMAHRLRDRYPDTAAACCEEILVAMTSFDGDPELLEHCLALDRIRRGQYGRCVACGNDIPLSDLRIQPTRHFCPPCAIRLTDHPPGPLSENPS